ncbi:hypothetical protein [Paenibacillus sp. YYML68]|uniref:golvesin C-terminal-like domain-containing protein n=1 Tax=Paenibacillus sp. YYML68 TaxID=2909250 RepID=UPI00249224A3|nr:hypothetical protein [Paenibacillus sp. YYML68]
MKSLRKTCISTVMIGAFVLAAGTSYATSSIIYDGGTGWSQGHSSGSAIVVPGSTSCGFDGKMRWTQGESAYSDESVWGKWSNQNVPVWADSSFQYQVYIPNCNSNASVKYGVVYGTSSQKIAVDQARYSDEWVNLGTYFIPKDKNGPASFITLDTWRTGTSYKIGWDEAAFYTH